MLLEARPCTGSGGARGRGHAAWCLPVSPKGHLVIHEALQQQALLCVWVLLAALLAWSRGRALPSSPWEKGA